MFTRENLNLSQKYFLWTLAGSVAIYFAATRLVQDFLYRGWKRPENLFESFGPLFAHPEPLEMPLYVLGFVVIPLLAIVLQPFAERVARQWKYLLIAAVVMFALSGYVFLQSFNFDFYFNYLEDKGIGKVIWLLLTKRLYISYMIFVVSAVALVFFYVRTPALGWFKKYANLPLLQKLEPIFLVLLAFLIFHPNLPTQDHHYNYFIGSSNDALHGKPLLYETSHLYGLLNIYFLIFVFKFFLPLSYTSLSAILAVFFFLFFAALYFFLKHWLRSSGPAILGTLAVITLIFFFQTSPTRTVYFFPAMGPLRFWLYVPVLFLILAYQKSPRTVLREVSLFLSAAAVFWNLDSGVFLSAATLLTFAYTERFSARKTVTLVGKFGEYVLGIFTIITAINYLTFGALPHWGLFFKELSPFGRGIGMSLLPRLGVFEIFVLLYVGVGIWIWQKYQAREKVDLPLLFLVIYGIFSFLYYIGESTWQNLYLVSVPPVLIAFYFFRNFSDNRLAKAIFCAVLVYAGLFLLVKLPVEFQNRDYTSVKSLALAADCAEQNLYADALEIKDKYPAVARLPLMHLTDTRMLLYIGKPNFFDFYYMFSLYYRQDVERAVARLAKEKPKHLFVGKQTNDQINYFLSLVGSDYKKTESLRTVDVYERK